MSANINEVERITCEKVGCKYSVGLFAGTAALHMAVKLAGVKPGGKVFCSDMTFDATVNPVVYEGGVPVFIDTERDTWNMDPVALEKAFELYPDVKVVVVAHLYGTPGKVDEIKAICDRQARSLLKMQLNLLVPHTKVFKLALLVLLTVLALMAIMSSRHPVIKNFIINA